MAQVKIKNIDIKGLRGVRGQLQLPLNERSVLLYGDNGNGKSSISDAIEWFLTGNVSHLSKEGIDLKEALRNTHLNSQDPSLINISFNNSKINCERKLYVKKDKLVADVSNDSEDFSNYLTDTEKENLLLRYQHLRDFIDNTKTDKLKVLSDIIGFSEVTKTKECLKKSFNSIKQDIKAQNFETQINTQKQTLIEKIGAAVSIEKDLIKTLNEIIKPLNTGIKIYQFEDIDTVLELIKSPFDNELITEKLFLEECSATLVNLKSEIGFISTEYERYYKEFEKLAGDIEGLKQIFLSELLEAGYDVLEKKYHEEESCPLCLQSKDTKELKEEITKRLANIEEISKKQEALENERKGILKIISERSRRLEVLTSKGLMKEKENKEILTAIEALESKLSEYRIPGNEKVTSGNKLKEKEQLSLNESNFEIISKITSRIDEISKLLKRDDKTELYANISASKDAFLRIKKVEKERALLDNQKNALEAIYNQFIIKQKEGLEDFITAFSTRINEYYQYMNPGEQFHDIRISTVGDEEELKGLAVEYTYYGNWISPPQKYFSESHLNCFGISFFLASVSAFNNSNRFIILDDVISSFDTNHRKKFADLLFNKFSDYQIILLTHEEEWFKYISQIAKGKGWLIDEIKWSEEKGTFLGTKLTDLKEIIETNLAEANIELLGNPIRQYLENKLKEICVNLEVKVAFRYNDNNEGRMANELLNELKSKLSKSSELKAKIHIIDNVANSNILGNLLSHDNQFNPKVGDLKAFWYDIMELEKLFFCQIPDCKRPKVSKRDYDTVTKKIRCGCGSTSYDWKE